MLVAIGVDRFAFHVLHNEVRQTVGGGAAVEQSRDVGVLESCKNQSLAPKPENRQTALGSVPNQFDGYPFVELAIGAGRKIDFTHPAAADLLFNPVCADAGTDLRLLSDAAGPRRRSHGGNVRFQKRLDRYDRLLQKVVRLLVVL